MLAANAGLLVLAFGLQLTVYAHGGHTSLADLPHVLLHRQISPGAPPYLDRFLEYPVGSGLLLYLAVLVAPGNLGAFALTALAAAGLSLGITVVLERRFGARAWRWALGAPLFFYAFQNWDVFAIAALLVGLIAFERHRDRLSGAMLGIGAAVKLFPAVFLAPAVAIRWREGDRRGALRLVTSAVAVFAVINVPVFVARPSGWLWTFAFQSRRAATWGTAWSYLYKAIGAPSSGLAGAHLANIVALVALVGGLGWLTVRAVRVPIPAMHLAAAAVAIFLLANKVWSPCYDLWLVAFFVIVPTSRKLWLSFCALDVAIFVTVYGYFHGLESLGAARVVMPFFVLARTAVVLTFVYRATRAPALPGEASVDAEPLHRAA